MEKENIGYRRLRDKNRGKVGKVSASLLNSIAEKTIKRNEDKGESIMSQNVNQYLHMIKDSHLKENYIKWAISLRRKMPTKQQQNEQKQYSVPNVYYKTTQAQNNRIQTTKSLTKKQAYNSATFDKIISRNIGSSSTANQSIMTYMTGLREWKNEISTQPRPSFTTVPFKERKNHPKIIKKEFMKKIKNIEENERQIALDGSQNYPTFTQKIVKERNYALTSTFTSGKLKSSLPNLAWQMGLRYS